MIRYVGSIPLTVFFGAATIIMIWLSIFFQTETEFQSARLLAEQRAKNFARVFDEHVEGTVRELDKALIIARKMYRNTRQELPYQDAIQGPLPDPTLLSDMSFQLATIDRNGLLTRTTLGKHPPNPIDLSDRIHFKVHRDDTRPDKPYISAPVLGRRSGRWSVQLTRRLNGANGSFDGVVVASIDPRHFSDFYGSIDLGPGSLTLLVGDDGIVRASNAPAKFKLGGDLANSELKTSKHEGIHVGQIEDSDRSYLYAVRQLENQPMFVAVAIPIDRIDALPRAHMIRNAIIGGVATLLIGAAMIFGIFHQLSLRRAQRDLAASEARAKAKSRELELTFQNMGQGIMMVDGQGDMVVANARAMDMLDFSQIDTGKPTQFLALVDRMAARGEFHADPQADTPLMMERIRSIGHDADRDYYERKRPNGTVLAVQTQRLPDGGFVRTLTDITERHRAEEKIAHLARHDALTNLANRALFRETLDNAIRSVDRTSGFTVMFIDLDDFKAVNDTHGHPVGDELLRQVANRLLSSTRAGDTVARVGGDEFAIVLRGLSDEMRTAARAQHLVDLLREPFFVEERLITTSVSVGCAMAPRDGTTTIELLRNVDIALYHAKSAGRSTYRVFEEQMAIELMEQRRVEEELSHAIARKQLVLHYQPQICIATGRCSGFEALLRWNHPERGLVPPAEFIPIAESSGMLIPIGRWVLNEACREASKWESDLRIAVNLSPTQFRNPKLTEDIRNALDESNLDAKRLELEITESVMMQNTDYAVETLGELHDIGCKISMDDFGTGYSSLSYLRMFPIDKIKIDRSFVKELGNSEECNAIVQTIISLAECLKMSTTAEGVETREQLDILREMGCTEVQGFFFSPAKPASELHHFLNRMRRPRAISA